MSIKSVSTKKLAKEFVTILRGWLTPAEFRLMRLRNRNETNPNVCHSHDFCDANMAMLEALTNLNCAAEFDPADESHCAVWNEAWDLAKPQLGFVKADPAKYFLECSKKNAESFLKASGAL